MSDAKVRFRIAAAVSRAPSGARFVLSSDQWAERFRVALS